MAYSDITDFKQALSEMFIGTGLSLLSNSSQKHLLIKRGNADVNSVMSFFNEEIPEGWTYTIENTPAEPLIEKVNHPSHYGGGDNPHELIKCLRAHLTKEEMIGALKFNIVKYTLRAGKKDSTTRERDHAASKWYNDYLNEMMK